MRGRWALRWSVDGRVVQEITPFRVGPKEDRRKAEELLAQRTEIFRLRNKSDQLAVLIARRQAIEDRIKELQAQMLDKPKTLLLSDLAQTWRSSPRRKDTSADQAERYERQIARFVEFAGGEVDFRAVGDALVERFAARLAREVGPNTYNKALNALQGVWKAVGARFGVQANPWEGLPRKRLDTHVRRALTKAETDAIVAAAEGEYKGLVLIGLYTGLRLGDACLLKWEDFDKAGVLRVTTRKTGAAVALPAAKLRDELRKTLGANGRGFVMPAIAERYQRDAAGVSDWVCRYFKRAGIKTSVKAKGWSKARPDASYHSLRHTFVTRAIERGVPAPIVRALVGHASESMTTRYTHISEAAILGAFAKMD